MTASALSASQGKRFRTRENGIHGYRPESRWLIRRREDLIRGACPATRKKEAAVLQRTTFEISRAAEYFDRRELEAQTDQPVRKFVAVLAKELVDNSLEAAESIGVPPLVHIAVRWLRKHVV